MYLDKEYLPLTAEEIRVMREQAENMARRLAQADAEAAEAVQETFDLLDAWEAAGCPGDTDH